MRRIIIAAILTVISAVGAVSDTHLDVYKRQVIACMYKITSPNYFELED